MQTNIEKSRKWLFHPKIDKMTLIMIKPRVGILQKTVLFWYICDQRLGTKEKIKSLSFIAKKILK